MSLDKSNVEEKSVPGKHALTPPAAILVACVSTVLLGIVDWSSGYELNFFVFYFIPVVIAAWYSGRIASYFMSMLCGVVWFLADRYTGHTYSSVIYAVWNGTIRAIAFFILGFAVARIRELLDEERLISRDLEKAMSQVKTLGGLLPICATCKKIRTDTGYWLQLEEYIERHSDAQFTHGICQECAEKMLRDAGIVRPENLEEELKHAVGR